MDRVAALVVRVSAGGWFEAYDLFMTSYIALGLYRERLFAPSGAGVSAFASFIAAGFAGMFVGTLFFGWVSDRYGRRRAFGTSLLFYSLATLVMATMGTAVWIDVWRFLAGIGIGVQIITVDTYVSEVASAGDRGKFIALSQALTFTAVPIVAALAAWLVPLDVRVGVGAVAGWRVVAALGATGAFVAPLLVRALPETSRWSDARELGVPRLRGWRDLFGRAYRARTLALVFVNLLQVFGYYGFTSWVTTLLYQEHVTYVRSLQYTAIIALAYPAGPLLAMWFADRWERKWQIAVLSIIIAAAGLAFGAARLPVAIVCSGTIVSLALNWFSSAFHAYQAELFPTAIRARAVGFVYSWSRLSSIGVGYVVGAMLALSGPPAVFAVIAAAMVLVALIVAVFGPRTNRLELETIAP